MRGTGWVGELVDLLLPRPCPGCGGPQPWCAGCAATLGHRPREVRLPEQALDALAETGIALPAVRALSRYGPQVRGAVIAGKERGRRDLPPLLGRALGAGLLALQRTAVVPEHPWLVPAPTRAAAARRRGGDPVLRMARAAAQVLAAAGRPVGVAPCLSTRRGARDSTELTAGQRAANLADRVAVHAAALPPAGAGVVLLDDVLTTGATLVASVRALHTAGVEVVAVLTLAAVPPWRTAR